MKGILFSEPLFPLVVNGTKTQTRRIVTEKVMDKYYQYDDWCLSVGSADVPTTRMYEKDFLPNHSRYKVGETVYLKEPYIDCDEIEGLYYHLYKYNGDHIPFSNLKWTNKLFMPESAARYFIEITGVRVEKLQDISEEDCIKEGIQAFTKDETVWKYGLDGWNWTDMPRNPKDAYAELIDSINGKGTCDSNPYVWVYDFKMLEGRP